MTKKRVAILVSGSGSNMVSLLDSMTADHPARAVLVLSNNANAGGLAKAQDRGIATQVIDHRPFSGDRLAFQDALQAALQAADTQIVCLAGFMRILTPEFTDKWRGKMLNIHPSLLPKYRGLKTHTRALADQETQHGCTVHEVTGELDEGPIRGQAIVNIKPGDTAQTLAARVLKMEHRLYPAVLRRFSSGDLSPVFLP